MAETPYAPFGGKQSYRLIVRRFLLTNGASRPYLETGKNRGRPGSGGAQDGGMPETCAPSPPIVYQLRVVLRGVSPLIWRRLLVSA